MEESKYKKIVAHYENCLKNHGDSYKGVDWPNQDDAIKRYRIMLDIMQFDMMRRKSNLLFDSKIRLCDLGCGCGHMYQYILDNHMDDTIEYNGIDLSVSFVDLCKSKWNDVEFKSCDILRDEIREIYNYVIMNGVFTEKTELSYDEMWSYFKQMIKKVYSLIDVGGMSFNVMSKDVDWERDDLFHVPMSDLSSYLAHEITRDFVIRNDYGLYEYTVYVYK